MGTSNGWPTDRTKGDNRKAGQVQRRQQSLSGRLAFRLAEMGSALHMARPSQGNGPWERNERAAVRREGKGSERYTRPRGGLNPIAERRRTGGIPTFGAVADEVCETLVVGFRNVKHKAQWKTTLATYAAPLRNKPVDTISTDDVLAVLKPIWTTKPETASRVRGRIEKVLDAAKAKGFRQGENPARWRGHLDHLLPKPSNLARGHHAAMPYEQRSRVRREPARARRTRRARSELCILTAARSGELLGMRWSELDLRNDDLEPTAERMKAGRPHRVPLSARAVAILRKLDKSKRRANLCFPVTRRDRPLSNMAMDMVLRRMNVDVTVHGFRSSFRDWAGNETRSPREIVETALAHVIGDKAEQAYRRSDALEKRRKLMEAWASYCSRQDNVVPMISATAARR